MQRRKVELPLTQGHDDNNTNNIDDNNNNDSNHTNTNTNNSPSKTIMKRSFGMMRTISGRRGGGGRMSVNQIWWCLLVMMITFVVLAMVLSFLFHPMARIDEMSTKNFVNNAYQVQKQVSDYLHPLQQQEEELQEQEQVPKSASREEDGTLETEQERDNHYLSSSSSSLLFNSWVEGEKKLKVELKKLYDLQQRGKELGVPVLTRYLGNDIPAWAGQGINREQWQASVDAKYQQMAHEEQEWKKRIQQTLFVVP